MQAMISNAKERVQRAGVIYVQLSGKGLPVTLEALQSPVPEGKTKTERDKRDSGTVLKT